MDIVLDQALSKIQEAGLVIDRDDSCAGSVHSKDNGSERSCAVPIFWEAILTSVIDALIGKY